ncbi:hypothetical protein C3488_24455 [Streptomyces sp. Ru72]|nr:hypothetical protein C3488_24455 [Streptomyces sp. Ru72]
MPLPPPVTPPAEFGTDGHDPLTAARPVAKPLARFCRVTLAEAQFRDFTSHRGTGTRLAAAAGAPVDHTSETAHPRQRLLDLMCVMSHSWRDLHD